MPEIRLDARVDLPVDVALNVPRLNVGARVPDLSLASVSIRIVPLRQRDGESEERFEAGKQVLRPLY